MDFLYYFATVTNETHPGLARVEGSPIAGKVSMHPMDVSQQIYNLTQSLFILFTFPGVPAFLVLAVTGLAPEDGASFSHVTLLGAQGETLQEVMLNSSSPSSYSVDELVGRVDSVPRVPFCVQLTGRDGRGNKLERVSTETVQPTHVQIQVTCGRMQVKAVT